MHTLGQAANFVEKVFGNYQLLKHGVEISVACPICVSKGYDPEKKKLAIRLDNWWVHCWICSYKSKSIYNLVKDYHPSYLNEFVHSFCDGIIPYELDEFQKENDTKLELPNGFTLLAEQFDNTKSIAIADAKHYLTGRGATLRDFWYFKYGVAPIDKNFKFMVIIPSFDLNGELNYFTSRKIFDSKVKKNKYRDADIPKTDIVFNEINIDWTKELTIVEGPFDLLKCNDNATCLLGSSLETKTKLFQKIVEHDTPVLLALDNDAQDKQLAIAKKLTEYGVFVRLYKVPKELNDVGQMSKKDFLSGINNSELFTLEDELKIRLKLI